MNANRIIDMIVRQVMRRLVTKGVDKGFDMAGKMTRKPGQPSDDPESSRRVQETPGHQSPGIKQAQRMTRQMRRFMRF
ncbi:hypothetical protein [Ruegeria halocynthiae]|uniref:hypothetical protein n=1 Tax=Ruegeria halocynthiae TaxID=985054 RepID=UPI000561F7E3|nr:hypothetical protein [Ruegeria halocynthiae]